MTGKREVGVFLGWSLTDVLLANHGAALAGRGLISLNFPRTSAALRIGPPHSN